MYMTPAGTQQVGSKNTVCLSVGLSVQVLVSVLHVAASSIG